MRDKSFIGAAVAGVVLVVLIVVISVNVGRSSKPEASSSPSAAAAKWDAASSPSPKPSRTMTPTPSAPAPAVQAAQEGPYIVLTCTVEPGSGVYTEFRTLQEVWALGKPANCMGIERAPGELSDVQKQALQTAYGPDYRPQALSSLMSLCSRTEGPPIDIINSALQAREMMGAFVLCPDHPKAAAIEASLVSGQAMIDAEDETKTAIAEGRQLGPGNYLVGVDLQPGLWQSVGERVTDCYWELSDFQGNIIENNFISVAPQFTITVPASAAGFTIQGCAFRRIG